MVPASAIVAAAAEESFCRRGLEHRRSPRSYGELRASAGSRPTVDNKGQRRRFSAERRFTRQSVIRACGSGGACQTRRARAARARQRSCGGGSGKISGRSLRRKARGAASIERSPSGFGNTFFGGSTYRAAEIDQVGPSDCSARCLTGFCYRQCDAERRRRRLGTSEIDEGTFRTGFFSHRRHGCPQAVPLRTSHTAWQARRRSHYRYDQILVRAITRLVGGRERPPTQRRLHVAIFSVGMAQPCLLPSPRGNLPTNALSPARTVRLLGYANA